MTHSKLTLATFVVSSLAFAGPGRGLYSTLPPFPTKARAIPDCAALSDASAALSKQSSDTMEALNARAAQAQAEAQKKGLQPDVKQALLQMRAVKEIKDADPSGKCIIAADTLTANVKPALVLFHDSLAKTIQTRDSGIKACPVTKTGESPGPVESCAKPLREKATAETEAETTAFLKSAAAAYVETQHQNLLCIAQAGDINSTYFAKATGQYKSNFDPDSETVQAAGMASSLTDGAAQLCLIAVNVGRGVYDFAH